MDAPDHADGITRLIDGLRVCRPDDLQGLVDRTGAACGARSVKLHVADYSLRYLRVLDREDTVQIEGSMAGRAFASGQILTAGTGPVTVWVPLIDRAERFGVLELEVDRWDDEVAREVRPRVKLLVLSLVSDQRYGDGLKRARRARSLSVPAEMQWDLLPPLTSSVDAITVSGILEPAYEIGGDCFDYAFNPGRVEFSILDAMGHGLNAVLLSVAAMGAVRNARRDSRGIADAYLDAGRIIEEQFGSSRFVTGDIGWIDTVSGEMSWLNAGHPPPLLVRDRTNVSELVCPPSIPMGLGGDVVEVATESLQPGDRVLFFTDGITEAHHPSGAQFGTDRLAEFLVKASLDEVNPAETVRRLSAAVLDHHGETLADDATMLMIEWSAR